MKVLRKTTLGAAVALALAVGLAPIASAQQGTIDNPKGEPAAAPIEQNNNSAAAGSGTYLHSGFMPSRMGLGIRSFGVQEYNQRSPSTSLFWSVIVPRRR